MHSRRDIGLIATPLIQSGFSEYERPIVARLFGQAFRRKLHSALRPKAKALQFIETVLTPKYALSARDGGGTLLGVAGFKTHDGALIGGGFRELAQVYGWFGALWRGTLLSVLERKIEPGVLLMDGIFIECHARGRGIGTALLRAIKDHAYAEGLH